MDGCNTNWKCGTILWYGQWLQEVASTRYHRRLGLTVTWRDNCHAIQLAVNKQRSFHE
jgi:hypothetical protein